MRNISHTWVVVLAGGEGTRLRTIMRDHRGNVIPKQYCSLERSPCLLNDAILRAGSVAMPPHICAVVAAQHRQWWSSAVKGISPTNVFVQPQNKGTALGILLALLELEMRDPAATVVFLPADHYFRDERPITQTLRVAANLAASDPASTFLLGADPRGPDPELGYVLPRDRSGNNAAAVVGFAEKPHTDFARELISLGALWNLFILVGSVRALLQLFDTDHAAAVSQMRALLQTAPSQRDRLNEFYHKTDPVDFSHDVLALQTGRLRVIRVPHCGWTDLGTPKRVETAVRNMRARTGAEEGSRALSEPLFLNLASRWARYSQRGLLWHRNQNHPAY